LILFRLEIQAKVRQLGRNPGITGRQTVENAREQLTALVHELRNSMQVVGVVEIHNKAPPIQEPLAIWDEIVYEPVPGGSNGPVPVVQEERASAGPIQIENQLIPLPSNGNVDPKYAKLELSHRISHADQHLNRIRDLIAEKSFQFSHVIRVAPSKAITTRSRGEVKKINLQISVHCRLYTQCRARIIQLGADPATINRFSILSTEDVKASTAIVNPNESGSTQLKLSWIWQTSGGHRWGLASRQDSAGAGSGSECMFCSTCKVLIFF